MSRALSSKKPSLPPPPTPTATTTTATSSAKKEQQSPRNPLQDLTRISSSSNSSYASSVSTEPPRGCLRFLSSSAFKTPVHRPKNLSKTPNYSAPNNVPALKQSRSKSSKENLSSKGNAGQQTKGLGSEKARTFRKNPPCLYQWQSSKKSGSRAGQKAGKPCSVLNDHGKCLPRLLSASEELKRQGDSLGRKNDNAAGQHARLESCHNDANLTPLSQKAARLDLDITVYRDVEENLNTSISRTPPIQNSVSPEIQCGSSLVSMTTPACYSAGYVVSGVADKRKCRPRGILTIEENISSFEDDDDDKKIPVGNGNGNGNPSLLPLPTEALVHWLSSPHNKGKKDLSRMPENELNQSGGLAESTTLGSSTSTPSSHNTILNTSDSSDLSGAANGIRRKMSTSISPSGLPEFQALFDFILSPSRPHIFVSPNSTASCQAGSSEKGKSYQHNPIGENSPFSLNSLGSGNVIQTPQSDSSSDLHVGLSWVQAYNGKEDNSCLDLDSDHEVLPSENFSLNSSAPFKDSVNSSFQFDCLTVPYESIDLSKLPKFLDDQDPLLSSSTIENASQSQMRISWREGLMSQLYELDEFDYCRCLSDEEDLAIVSGSNKLPIPHDPQVNVEVDGDKKMNNDAGITETDDNELEIVGLCKEMFPALISCSGAESISTDGGGLVASRDDSDWKLCYKNKLFEV